MTVPKVGDRIRLVRRIRGLGNDFVPEGTTGIVVEDGQVITFNENEIVVPPRVILNYTFEDSGIEDVDLNKGVLLLERDFEIIVENS